MPMDSTTLESSCKVQQILMSQDNVLVFTTIVVMLFMLATFMSVSLFLAALRDQQSITLMVSRDDFDQDAICRDAICRDASYVSL